MMPPFPGWVGGACDMAVHGAEEFILFLIRERGVPYWIILCLCLRYDYRTETEYVSSGG